MITVGPLAAKRIGSAGWASSALSLSLICRQHLVHLDDAGAELVRDLVDDLLRGLDAHVGLDQLLEQLVEERLVDQPALRS